MKSLWEKLEEYSASDYYPFHMPGHKRFPKENALAFHKRFPKENALAFHKRFPLENIYLYDITEIEGFDNLHDAKGILRALQQKAARIYHAEQSFFLVNGSTGGILSAVSTVAKEGKKLLIARNCHKSVYNAILLNRLHVEYLWPDMIEEFDVQGGISAEEVKKHLAGRKDICGVVITSPTYDGIVSDICQIAEEVHLCHIPLIVDEAHGAHFVLSEKAPKSAVECGADLVINSVHKTLPALTQTALLHVQGTLVDREKLKNYLSIYQSSSPSYILMASIDKCVDFIEDYGAECFEMLLAFRKRVDEKASGFLCLKLLFDCENRDPGKLVISVKDTDITGQELYRILLEKYYLQLEMATPTYVLGILTGMDTWEGVERLIHALTEIDGEIAERMGDERKIKRKQKMDDIYSIIPKSSGLSIFEVAQKKKDWIPLEQSDGRVSGGMLCFYPPWIPFIVPGEIIGKEQISQMEKCRKNGEYLTGVSEEGKLCVLRE